MQVEHGRIRFLTARCPILGASVAVVLVPVVPSMIGKTIPRIVGRGRSILPRGDWGGKVKVQEFVCMLLTSICTLLLLAIFRVATH